MRRTILIYVLVTLLACALTLVSAQEQEGTQTEETQTEETQTEETQTEESESTFAWQELGQQTYSNNCAACHQAEGQGIPNVYPQLAGSDYVTGETEPVILTLLNGRGGMPSFRADLSTEEIAAVISYIRNSWGNEASVVTPEMVAAQAGDTENESSSSGGTTSRPGAAD